MYGNKSKNDSKRKTEKKSMRAPLPKNREKDIFSPSIPLLNIKAKSMPKKTFLPKLNSAWKFNIFLFPPFLIVKMMFNFYYTLFFLFFSKFKKCLVLKQIHNKKKMFNFYYNVQTPLHISYTKQNIFYKNKKRNKIKSSIFY